MTSMTHHYFVTDTVPEFQELDTELPVVRDDRKVSGYIRMEQKSGLIGIYEKENPNTVWEDHCPWDAENELFQPDYDRVMPWLENAMERMPLFADLGIKRDVHGAISHPPMVHGAADISMRDYDPRRFGNYADKPWQVIKAKEDYCLRHEIPFPHFNRLEGRPIKPSPLYERLKNKGAVFEEVYGHERPRWFAKAPLEQRDYYSFKRNEVHDVLAKEVAAVRNGVGIMDICAFTKVEVNGSGAASFLESLVANKLPKKQGGIIVAHFLNECGRIELEATIVRLADTRYYIVCAAFFEQRLLDHLGVQHSKRYKNEIDDNKKVNIVNLSNAWGALSINGPNARRVLSECTQACWAFRMSYAGELGWEIHTQRDNLGAIYDALWAAGDPYNISDYGSFAMNTMRLVIEPNGVEDGHGGEAVLLNGELVGSTASITYGHTVGKILAFAYISPAAAIADTRLEVIIAGERRFVASD